MTESRLKLMEREKYSELLSELKNLEIHLKANPAVIFIESVNGCPYSCVMCKTSPTKPQKISEKMLKKIEPYFKDLEVLGIHGTGEPLLADLDYFVEQSIKHDFVLHMNSTGFFLTSAKADLLLTTRLSIRFSIHAGKAETYKRIMGGDLNAVKKNISYLVEKSMNTGKNCDFWFSFIVMKENINEIEEFLHLSNECGIKSVRFMSLTPRKHTIKGVKIRNFEFKHHEQFNNIIKNEFQKKLPYYKELAEKLNITLEFGSMLSCDRGVHNIEKVINRATKKIFDKRFLPLITAKGSCLAPWIGQLNISQDGDVKICCDILYSLGNLNDFSLEEIWNSDKMKRVRKSFRKGCVPHECGYCKGFGFSCYPNNSFTTIRRS